MKLSENLKRIRRDNNLSQEQLAEKLGVSRQAVSKWESGQSYPEMDKVLLICKLFNYNLDELMNENVKEIDEAKQSKININKYIDDFFDYITKTVDMLSSMKFRQKVKCLTEQFCVGLFLFVVFLILGEIFSYIIFDGLFGNIYANIYYVIRNILKSIYVAVALIIGTTILLHIFKIRYLDYYEIVKEENNEDNNEDKIQEDNNDSNNSEKTEENENKRKIFIEKKKEKIIIRDPNHSQSKFLTGLLRIILAFIKFMAVCVATVFAFSFIALFCLLILSFMFVKTGLIFCGCLFAIISGIIINFIILEWFYNFIVSKKSKRTRMAISFVVALILAGISIGMILIGVTQFDIISATNIKNEIEDVYEYEMSENLSINSWNCSVEYIEVDSSNIKIVIEHSKYSTTYINKFDDTIEVYCNPDEAKTMELIRDVIKDINNKEIKEYPNPKMYVYASKENIEKIKENEIKKYNLRRQKELDEALQLNEELETKILDLEEQIQIKENTIESLEIEIEEKENIINSLQETNETEEEQIILYN